MTATPKGNWVLAEIRDAVIASKESCPWLPEEFGLELEDTAFVALITDLKSLKTGKRIPVGVKRISITVQEHRVTVRSDADPEPWLPATPESVLN